MNMPNLSGAVRARNPFTPSLLGFLVLTIGFQWMTLEYSASSSVTVDEFAHLPAGITTWETGTFQSYRENPPLVRGLLALPAWLAGAKMDYTSARAGLGERSEWQVGTDFMHANKANYLELYGGARFVNLLIATGCGLLIFLWSYELAGPLTALVCSALWYADTNIIAHSGLATVDVGASTLGLLATYLFWRSLKNPGWRASCAAGVALGVALASKFSMVALYPAWLGATLIASLLGRFGSASARGEGVGKPFLNFAVIIPLSVVTLNAVYLFQGSGTRLNSFAFASHALSEHQPDGQTVLGGNKFRGQRLGVLPIPLPKDYVLGLDSQIREEEVGFANINEGRLTRNSPAQWYSPFATLGAKLPVGTLILILSSLAVRSASRRRPSLAEIILLSSTISIFALVCIHTRINWLFRYSLPALPLVVVLCSTGLRSITSRRLGKILVLASLFVNLYEVLSARPFYLSHGNLIIGG